jgi:hypothetical protein
MARITARERATPSALVATKTLVPSWSAESPVILIGHSAGAQTCLRLQALLARDFWNVGASADWIEAVVSVAGVLNGSLLAYRLGCDKRCGLLTGLPWPGSRLQPDATISPILLPTALYQARDIEFTEPPIESWGAGALALDEWRRNDGAVSAISQRYPFTAQPEPVGGKRLFSPGARLERGKWYYEELKETTGRCFDHFDLVIGSQLKPWMREPHCQVYRRLGETLLSLKED